jgi:hypothetical protein
MTRRLPKRGYPAYNKTHPRERRTGAALVFINHTSRIIYKEGFMHRILRMTLLIVIALSMFALPAVAEEFSADMLINAGGRQMTSKMFSKDGKQRVEIATPGGKMINIIDFKTGKVFSLMPAQKMYMELEGMDDATLKQIKDFRAGKTPPGAKKVGSEKVSGYSTDVYMVDDPKSGKTKMWYAPKLKYPVKSEGAGPMGKHSMQLTNIKEGGVSDSLFKVPAGYKKFSMPKGMPGGKMPGGMGGMKGQ